MSTHYVFTLSSLQACLFAAPANWFGKLSGNESVDWQVQRVELHGTVFFIHESDEEPARRMVILNQEAYGFSNSRWMKRSSLERIHRAAIAAANPPISLPRDWHAYRHNNLFSFFGGRRTLAKRAMRWTAESRPQGSLDVAFWSYLPSDEILTLQEFRPDYEHYEEAVLFWDDAIKEARARFSRSSPAPVPSIAPAVALQATFGATSRGRRYSEWHQYLSPDQRAFLEQDPPVKLRGPAGTGKTLCLILKAIREIKIAHSRGESLRVAFLTHSWAMQKNIEQLIEDIDEGDARYSIEVFPLYFAGNLLLSSSLPSGLEPLGEDSHSGKKAQLARIYSLIERALSTDWPAYRSQCRPEFIDAVESTSDSDERRLFAWEILNEFSCVLGPEGIMSGAYNAEQEYRDLPRFPWMMSLETDKEKSFILRLYGDYVDGLRRDNLIGADQVINDLVKDLEKATWQYQRLASGYDLLFVDELHLFNEQERRTLHYLTRDPRSYPKMFMALDPRQSAEIVYTGVSGRAITKDEPGRGNASLGGVAQLSLSRVHRFGREVLTLLRHINKDWPQLDLGDDWELDLETTQSVSTSTDIPTLYRHKQRHDEAAAALQSSRNWNCRTDGCRVAVVLVDGELLDVYEQVAAELAIDRLNILSSRDDIATLQYTNRAIVLGAAEYVAGLQFDTVIVGGLPRLPRYSRWPHTRRLLSQLYLAISRASSHVEIHTCAAAGGLPDVLESAIRVQALKDGSVTLGGRHTTR
ncbi:MAG: hypothetical protein JXA67_01900 [Micromonosporaceae bacterium]|nr:hypothetical protein [Micromonosporaceae bacterium]